jgi:hypothetical protein
VDGCSGPEIHAVLAGTATAFYHLTPAPTKEGTLCS